MAKDVTQPLPSHLQVIQRYDVGGFRISGVAFKGAVLVFPERTLAWTVAGLDDVSEASLAEVVATPPDILLLGTGGAFQLVPPTLRTALQGRRIAVESMTTAAACRTYNLLLGEERKVAAALLPLT